MKRIFIFSLLSILLLLRFSFSTKRTAFQQGEIHSMLLDVNESKATILKVDNKYPFEYLYAKVFYKEDGKYQGYFLIEKIKQENNFTFMELKEIKTEKVKKNFMENYLGKVFERSQKNFSYKLKNMNKALLLGDNTRLSKKLKEKIRYLGLSHIFAMSGLHIGLVFLVFYSICFRVFKKKIIIELTTLFFMTLYYLGVKESPSFSRAYIMIVIYLFGQILYEKVNAGKALFVSAVISILYRPNVIFSLSFQFSYLAMIAIFYFYPLVKKINIKKSKILDYILFTSSIQVFLIPIQIYYFETIPFISIPINILILPFATIFISLSYVQLFLENFYLGFLLEFFVEFSYDVFMYLIDIFSKIPNMNLYFYSKKIIISYIVFLAGIFYIKLVKKVKK
ncbi:ComEC/Rec2 family competence protein [Fusobacterium sp.]|uniref:ComEC/Rec2 family competence protein n=1 Tax=Fusobacterium sp. TaxID=68766 RepID=UPI0025B9DB29|nr:ComEC/Rec2 family competence protein [Fusobacterium sp.]MCI5724435.1 ComEC/Rec2 family competence protein [Fusobacterium sp.]